MEKKRMEINKDNYYVKHAAEIKALCDEHGCDVGQAISRFDTACGSDGPYEDSKEFLRLVNEKLRTGDEEGMTLDKLCEQL